MQRFLQQQPRPSPPPFFDPSDPVLTLQQQGFRLLPPQQAALDSSPMLQVPAWLLQDCAVWVRVCSSKLPISAATYTFHS